MKRKKPFKTVIAMLIMLSVVITTGTFAFWASEIQGTSQTVTSTLEIGSAKLTNTTISVTPAADSSFGYLVPAGQVENSEGIVTDQVDFIYQVLWTEQQEISQSNGETSYGDLIVDITYEIIIDGDSLPLDSELYNSIYELINIVEYTSNPNTLLLNSSNAEEFGFSVTLNEPANKTEYDLITNSTINFNLLFQIDTEVYDLDLDFSNLNMESLLAIGTSSTEMDKWILGEDDSLVSIDDGKTKYIFFPITKDEYTLTVTAQLQDIDSLSGGYGILFDTYFDNDDFYNDSGYILQFDRGYSRGELIMRNRVDGGEKNPFMRAGSEGGYLPSKYDDAAWWVSAHEITIEVTNYDETTRQASIYLDGEFIITTTFDAADTDEQMYVGFRVWGGSPTDFYGLTVE